MEPHKAFGVVLRQVRGESGLSQEELAYRCNLDRTYISMLERGVRKPTINTIFSIANGLGINPVQLVEEVNQLINNK